MYIRCYQSTNPDVYEQLWTLIYARGWVSDRFGSMRFYIPEPYVSFALCIDSSLVRVPKEDYIV
jgi:hypothetical protein